MFCNKCGSQLEDDCTFCPNCGNAIVNNRIKADVQTPAQPQTNYTSAQGQYGYPQGQNQNIYTQPQYQGAGLSDPLNDPRGMKWFKFIIYAQLFISALIMLITGIMTVTGSHYQGQAEYVYAFFPSLKAFDIIFGLLFILIGAACVYVRQRLAKFCQNGPKFYLILQGVIIVIELIYLFGASAILSVPVGYFLDASTVSSIITSVVMIAVNYVYFNKRSDLFIH